jgi:hypothetical protein
MAGRASSVGKAMTLLQQWGPARGYFPEPAKSIIICNAFHQPQCKAILSSFSFTYSEGHRYLGGHIGSPSTQYEWLMPKIQKWTSAVKSLAKIAKRYPQAAFAGFTKSLQAEWQYLQRVTDNIEMMFQPVEKAITEDLIPALFGLQPDEMAPLRTLFSLPTKQAGLGLLDPTKSAIHCYNTSKRSTTLLTQALLSPTGNTFSVSDHIKASRSAANTAHSDREKADSQTLATILETSSVPMKRCINRATETGLWLTISPSFLNGTELSADEFCDGLFLRYGLQPKNLPNKCDGCSQNFSVQHALSCKTGGLVLLRHNEVAREWNTLCAQAWSPSVVQDEPLIPHCPNNTEDSQAPSTPTINPETRGDVLVRGFWSRQTPTIFDVRITDTDAPSHRGQLPHQILLKNEHEKKKKHLASCLEARHHFTPLCFSVDGLFGTESTAATKRLAAKLSTKWKQPYSQVCGFIRSRIILALVRAASLCLRGSRDPTISHRTFQWEDGSGISLY